MRSDLPSDLLEDPDNVRLGEGQGDDRGLDNMGLAEQCDDSQGLHYKL